MAKQFRLGPIQSSVIDNVWISADEQYRETNLNSIKEYFRLKKEQEYQLVVCIMDSDWNDLRPIIKLNGTVNYGI